MSGDLCSHLKFLKGGKHYRAYIVLYGANHRMKTSRKQFKTAAAADAYARRWRVRAVGFIQLANQKKSEVQP